MTVSDNQKEVETILFECKDDFNIKPGVEHNFEELEREGKLTFIARAMS